MQTVPLIRPQRSKAAPDASVSLSNLTRTHDWVHLSGTHADTAGFSFSAAFEAAADSDSDRVRRAQRAESSYNTARGQCLVLSVLHHDKLASS